LNAYVDGELAASEAERVSDHLAECSGCAQQATDLKTLQLALGSAALYHQASGKLRNRVAQTLAASSTASLFTQPLSMKMVAAIFVSLALLAGAVGLVWWWKDQPPPTLMELSLHSHDRAVTCNRQTELTSSDSQKVKQWLQEKTGQAVTVKDLSAHKFTLVGSRVESSVLGVIPVLVYAAGDKTVSLYHWPTHCNQYGSSCHTALPQYQFSTWCDTQAIYWAVSEVPTERLLEFTKGMKGR